MEVTLDLSRKIWLSSDSHFGHANIIRYCHRPFDTVEKMNEYMVKIWNETVSEDDLVIYLGDFSLSFKPVEQYALRLNGEKYLVPGNHDKCFPFSENEFFEWAAQYEIFGFKFLGVGHQFWFNYKGKKIGLCHFPPRPSDEELLKFSLRFIEYRPKDPFYDLIFHGHVHEKEKEWKSSKGTPLINVGVDVHQFKPILLQEYLKKYFP